MTLFKSARIKLTLWYLLIIMAISLLFSAFIYRSVTREFQRRLANIENRLELHRHGLKPAPGYTRFFIQDIEEARKRVLLILLYTNGVILIFSAGASYFLAGKTLKPIEVAMEKQKRFVEDAAHELRTPLTALKTGIEVTLRSKRSTVKQTRQTLRESLGEIDSLQNLANNLLSLARYQKGNNFSFRQINLADVAEKASKKIKPLAESKQIKLKKDVERVKVKGIKSELEKLITILLDNAVKYTPEKGKISLIVKQTENQALIEVADTGVGIPEEDLPHVFERFYRVDPSRTKLEVEGAGLGLFMAKEIVNLHKGTTELDSIPGKGTTATIKLPISKS